MSRLAADVHVWIERVDPGAEDRLDLVLDDGERLRAGRFVRAADRCPYITAHWLLRQALSWAEPSVEPVAWRFRTAAYGKPELAGGWPGIRFSLSHGPEYVAVALADGIDCGMDVESTRRAGDLRPLAENVLSARERAAFLAADPADRGRLFFRYWTLKEAYSKAVGLGLRLPFDQLDFGSGDPAELIDETVAPGPVRDWSFTHWTRDGNSFAVAFRSARGTAPALLIRHPDLVSRTTQGSPGPRDAFSLPVRSVEQTN